MPEVNKLELPALELPSLESLSLVNDPVDIFPTPRHFNLSTCAELEDQDLDQANSSLIDSSSAPENWGWVRN